MNAERPNPFDDENGQFLVLQNREGQFSLWPDFAAIPTGWRMAFGPETRAFCVEFVEHRWSGALRPVRANAA